MLKFFFFFLLLCLCTGHHRNKQMHAFACYVRCSCTHASTNYFQTVSSLSHSSLSTFFRFFLLVLTLHPHPLTMSRLVRRLTLVVFHGVCVCVWHVCIRTHSSTPSFAYHCPSTTIIVKLFDLFPFTLVSSFFFSAVLSVAPHVTAPYHLFPRLSRFQVRFSFFFLVTAQTRV